MAQIPAVAAFARSSVQMSRPDFPPAYFFSAASSSSTSITKLAQRKMAPTNYGGQDGSGNSPQLLQI